MKNWQKVFSVIAIVMASMISTGSAAEVEIVTARPATDSRGSAVLEIVVTRGAISTLRDMSQAHLGQRFVVRLGNEAIMQPIFREPITSARFHVSDPKWSPDELGKLAEKLTGKKVELVAVP
jgi:hypothetical protein